MNYIIKRLREPSTYATLAAMTAAFGLSVEPGVVQNVTLAGTGVAGLLGMLLPEKPS